MNDTLWIALLTGALCIPATGCGPLTPGGGDDDDDDDAAGDDDDATDDPIAATIQELNDGTHEDGTLVTITGAIVTSELYPDDDFITFWVQDQLGGPGAGLTIGSFADVVEEMEEDLQPGDIVDLTGRFQYVFDEDLPRLSVDRASNISVTGFTDLPDAHAVPAEDIANGFGDRSLWGLVVELDDVATVDTTPSFATFGVFEADGVFVDDIFYWPDVVAGDSLDRLAGILTPWYGSVTLMPRFSEDVEYEPQGCEEAWDAMTENVQGVNCRGWFEGDDVSLSGLAVISPADFSGAFYVADMENRLFGGLRVFAGQDYAVPALGTVLEIEGEYEEYRGQSEISVWDADKGISEGASVELVNTHLDDVCDLTEAHEGTLVSIEVVPLLDEDEWGDSSNFYADRGYYPVRDCPHILVAGSFWDDTDDWKAETGGAGTDIVITGLVAVVSDRFENFLLNPRSADDWAGWAADR